MKESNKTIDKIIINFGENSKNDLNCILSESLNMKENERFVPEIFDPLKNESDCVEFHKADIFYLLLSLLEQEYSDDFNNKKWVKLIMILEKDLESEEKTYILMLFNQIFPEAEIVFEETE